MSAARLVVYNDPGDRQWAIAAVRERATDTTRQFTAQLQQALASRADWLSAGLDKHNAEMDLLD